MMMTCIVAFAFLVVIPGGDLRFTPLSTITTEKSNG